MKWHEMTEYISQYPTAQSATYVKATSTYTSSFLPYFATDPLKSLTDGSTGTAWICGSGNLTNQRLHIDLGSGKCVKKIYYENYHSSGSGATSGVKNITVQGSNSSTAFAELTYSTDTNWTTLATYSDEGLTTTKSTFDINISSNKSDAKYLYLNNNLRTKK